MLAKEQKSESAIHSFFERIALLLFFKERRERIAHDRSFFLHDLSKSIMSLFCKDPSTNMTDPSMNMTDLIMNMTDPSMNMTDLITLI